PSDDELEAIYASVPHQPYHYAGIITGNAEMPGVWGKGRKAEATDVIDTVRRIASVNGLEVTVEADQIAPWHPGRAAKFVLADGRLLAMPVSCTRRCARTSACRHGRSDSRSILTHCWLRRICVPGTVH